MCVSLFVTGTLLRSITIIVPETAKKSYSHCPKHVNVQLYYVKVMILRYKAKREDVGSKAKRNGTHLMKQNCCEE